MTVVELSSCSFFYCYILLNFWLFVKSRWQWGWHLGVSFSNAVFGGVYTSPSCWTPYLSGISVGEKLRFLKIMNFLPWQEEVFLNRENKSFLEIPKNLKLSKTVFSQ